MSCRLELRSVCCCDFDRGRSRRTEDKKGQAVSRRFEEVPCVAIRLRWALRTQWVEPARPSRLSWSAMARASGTNSTSFVDGKNMEITVSRVLHDGCTYCIFPTCNFYFPFNLPFAFFYWFKLIPASNIKLFPASTLIRFDAGLSEAGVKEAEAGGKALKDAGYTFDVAHTSLLTRYYVSIFLMVYTGEPSA